MLERELKEVLLARLYRIVLRNVTLKHWDSIYTGVRQALGAITTPTHVLTQAACQHAAGCVVTSRIHVVCWNRVDRTR